MIANEAGIESLFICQIDLFDEFSTVELPVLPDDTVQLLQKTRLRGRPMDIAIDSGEGERPARKRFESASTGDRPPRASRAPQHDRDSRPPFEKKTKPPFDKKPYEKKAFEKKPFDKKPFEKKPFAKKVFDGK